MTVTDVFGNGSATPIATLKTGDYVFLTGLFSANSNILVTTSQPVLMFQEMAGSNSTATPGFNFIPPLGADSSTSVDNLYQVLSGSGDAGVRDERRRPGRAPGHVRPLR